MSKLSIARVVLEFDSPLAIGSGLPDAVLDSLVVLDADGLPALPGSSVAGVLRDTVLRATSFGQVDRWFGHAKPDGSGCSSSVWVSWGRPHGADDRPVKPASLGGISSADDEVLNALKAGVVRDHVRLNERGAVDDHGKFDRSFVPAGARFTLEIKVYPNGPPIEQLLGWLGDCSFGSVTRSGFGRARIVRCHVGHFDLAVSDDAHRFRRLPVALWEPSDVLTKHRPRASKGEGLAKRYGVRLIAQHSLLIGGPSVGPNAAKISLFTERRIVWSQGAGRVQQRPVLPGTALRGALRHRTAFHLEVLSRESSDDTKAILHALFGTEGEEHQDKVAGKAGQQAARVRVPEVVLPQDLPMLRQAHVAIDRFTMGARDGMLFDEEALWVHEQTLELSIGVEERCWSEDREKGTDKGRGHREDQRVKRALVAFERALDDLCEGRLGLGRGNSRGHGFFEGTWTSEGRL